ncbi:transcriptional repressor general negative regulator of transcription subunit 4 [Ascosphaera acerosa]|nr:transcriptional repressor general negative regulator of transcription subunit 4 [Ascosphaera acerosa]
MPRTVTIIVSPLIKLAEEQAAALNRIPGCSACVVSATTKYADRELFKDIAGGKYSHIILGPEQVFSDQMRAMMKEPALANGVGLVAIDEAHLISQWRDFRHDYTNIHAMRRWLPRSSPMFACSATMPRSTERDVRLMAGLKADVEIVRVSVDRPEVSISLVPM